MLKQTNTSELSGIIDAILMSNTISFKYNLEGEEKIRDVVKLEMEKK